MEYRKIKIQTEENKAELGKAYVSFHDSNGNIDSRYYVFFMTPYNIAHFIGAHQNAKTIVLMDNLDRRILDTSGGFLMNCPDQELRNEIVKILAPIQMGDAEAEDINVVTMEDFRKFGWDIALSKSKKAKRSKKDREMTAMEGEVLFSDKGQEALALVRRCITNDNALCLTTIRNEMEQCSSDYLKDPAQAGLLPYPLVLAELIFCFLQDDRYRFDDEDDVKRIDAIKSFTASKEDLCWICKYLSQIYEFHRKHPGFRDGWRSMKQWNEWFHLLNQLISMLIDLSECLDNPMDTLDLCHFEGNIHKFLYDPLEKPKKRCSITLMKWGIPKCMNILAVENINVQAEMILALRDATRLGLYGKSYMDIPESILNQHGIYRDLETESILMDDYGFGILPHEECGYALAQCCRCKDFEEGFCKSCGELVDPIGEMTCFEIEPYGGKVMTLCYHDLIINDYICPTKNTLSMQEFLDSARMENERLDELLSEPNTDVHGFWWKEN